LLTITPIKLTPDTYVTNFLNKEKITIGGDVNLNPEQKPLYKTNVYVHEFISLLINIHGLLYFGALNYVTFKYDTLKLGVLCLTLRSTNFQLYRGGKFHWWRKLEYPEETTDMLQVTEKLLSQNVVSSTPRHEWDSQSQL
jgi:hypothetical protein